MTKPMFHTQEHRGNMLKEPLKCIRDDAWLGEGYYFWRDLEDAKLWGDASKRNTKRYDVYVADIEFEDILDTVFNEEHYTWWAEQLEKTAKAFQRANHQKPSLKELNDYFKDRAGLEITGILYQDQPSGDYHSLAEPIRYQSKTHPTYFTHRKRIQLVLYSLAAMRTFAHRYTGHCL